ncbi:hypothetical protein ACN47E_003001 [Coniothyrium glycines]
MLLSKRVYCSESVDGTRECFDDDGFWYSDQGIIVKWVILASLFALFMGWFVGGYIHAKRRLRAGKPLLAYHRFLISYSERRHYGQAGPAQNHFTFYQSQNPYQNSSSSSGAPAPAPAPYQQRQDGGWADPPPQYMGNDAPPQYFAPAGAAKAHPSQGLEMPQYGAPPAAAALQGTQQSGVLGGSSGAGVEQQGRSEALPPRPPQAAKAKIMGALERFRK